MNNEALISIGVVGVALFGAWKYTQARAVSREKEEEERQKEEQREQATQTGLAAGDRPLCPPAEPDCLARKILDDGLASNHQHVTPDFRDIYWREMDKGRGMAEAFRTAMRAERWKAGSQGQVFDRLKSHGLISDARRKEWTAEALAQFPHGYGVS